MFAKIPPIPYATLRVNTSAITTTHPSGSESKPGNAGSIGGVTQDATALSVKPNQNTAGPQPS